MRRIAWRLCAGGAVVAGCAIAIWIVTSRMRESSPAIRSPRTTTSIRTIDASELEANVRLCSDAVESLRTMAFDKFVRQMDELRANLQSVNISQFEQALRPLSGYVSATYFQDNPESATSSVESFRAYVDAMLIAVLNLGEAHMMEVPFPNQIVGVYEALVLERLRACKNEADEKGRKDVVGAAQEAIFKWKKVIGSEGGFARRYMHAIASLEVDQLASRGFSTVFRVMKGARSRAFDSIVAGYTPRWLNEDFGIGATLAEMNRGSNEVVSVHIPENAFLKGVCETARSEIGPDGMSSGEGLSRYLEKVQTKVREYGEELLSCGQSTNSELSNFEAEILDHFLSYAEYYTAKGNKECVEGIRAALGRWTASIESEAGLTRCWAKGLLASKKASICDRASRESVIKEIRARVCRLVLSGYAPLWLDKEFGLDE